MAHAVSDLLAVYKSSIDDWTHIKHMDFVLVFVTMWDYVTEGTAVLLYLGFIKEYNTHKDHIAMPFTADILQWLQCNLTISFLIRDMERIANTYAALEY